MPAQSINPEEQFAGAVNAMQQRVEELRRMVESKEQLLGADLADHPNKDHSLQIAQVLNARSNHQGAAEMFRIAMSYKLNQVVAKRN